MEVLLQRKERIALVICDLQHDILASLENSSSSSLPLLLSAIRIAIEAARNNQWIVIHSGLKFQPRYHCVNPNHKLYGALRKLNDKLGNDDKVHFFMSGWPGCDFVLPVTEDHQTIWRSSNHLPHELVDALVQQEVTKVYLVGVKASIAIQIASQMIMDRGIHVTVVRECVQDDDESRMNAALDHILPLYSTVISLEELVVDEAGGYDSFSVASKESFIRLMGKGPHNSSSNGNEEQDDSSRDSPTFCACDCGRRGLGGRYMELLLRRPGWKTYPTQTWYEDFIAGDFQCPLGKQICDFCDEPEFSKVSMYLYGREFLDEKDKVIELAGRFMPRTYRIDESQWVGGESPPLDDDDGAQDAPWFIKIADQNLGGAAIDIVKKPSEIMNHVNKNQRYVVQQHVIDPLLTDDGRKCHVKLYVLLTCQEDGVTWNLYTYNASLLSISPNPWSAEDLSKETQITIHRHHIPPGETIGWKHHWDGVYKKCQAGTAEVIEKAISSGKLKGRPQMQFEVFSVDWMPDTHGNIWMFEFNMSPAVWARNEDFDGLVDDGDERRSSLMKHDELMLKEALSVVIPDGQGPGQWEHVVLYY
jgi:nicotinamidase-related amidase